MNALLLPDCLVAFGIHVAYWLPLASTLRWLPCCELVTFGFTLRWLPCCELVAFDIQVTLVAFGIHVALVAFGYHVTWLSLASTLR